MFFNLIPDNEEKKERLKKLTTNLLSFVNKFTENNNTIVNWHKCMKRIYY